MTTGKEIRSIFPFGKLLPSAKMVEGTIVQIVSFGKGTVLLPVQLKKDAPSEIPLENYGAPVREKEG